MTAVVGLERALILAAVLALLALGGFLAYAVQWARDWWKEYQDRRVVRDLIREHRPRYRLSRQQRRAEARRISKQAANWIGGGKIEGGTP